MRAGNEQLLDPAEFLAFHRCQDLQGSGTPWRSWERWRLAGFGGESVERGGHLAGEARASKHGVDFLLSARCHAGRTGRDVAYRMRAY